jgi:spore coat polysaccharide biosynthesis predicted glycosyltransferase SpsG
VASIHDRGVAPLPSDLAIDGSVAARGGIRGALRTLVGPRFMVIDPRVASGPHASVDALLVVIALGGGPRVGLAQALAEQIVRLTPRARVVVAAGFVAGGTAPSAATSSIQWLGPRESLVDVLSQAAVAVVAGGVTLYEAAALGVPTVAVPIVAAQRPTVRAFARAGATIAPRSSEGIDPGAIAAAVRRLMVDRTHARRLAARGRQLVDGRGTERVARALHALAGGA